MEKVAEIIAWLPTAVARVAMTNTGQNICSGGNNCKEHIRKTGKDITEWLNEFKHNVYKSSEGSQSRNNKQFGMGTLVLSYMYYFLAIISSSILISFNSYITFPVKSKKENRN